MTEAFRPDFVLRYFGSARRNIAALAALLFLGLAVPGNAFAQQLPSPHTYASRVDAAGRVVGTISPDPDGTGPLHHAAVRTTFDAAGRVVKVERGELLSWQPETVLPAAWSGFTVSMTVETTYDPADRKLLETSKGADAVAVSQNQNSYDIRGNLECTARRMNPAQYSSPPASACNVGTEGTYGSDRVTRRYYDDGNRLLQIRVAVGTGDEQASETYEYTNNSKRRSIVDGNGNKSSLTYDEYDRLKRWTFPSTSRPAAFDDSNVRSALLSMGSSNAADYEEYGYDGNDNRASLRKRDGSTLTYQYDPLNRLSIKIVPSRAGLSSAQTRDVHFDYDLRGHMLKARFDSLSGEGITNSYNGFGDLIGMTVAMSGLTGSLAFVNDPDGQRIEITHPDNQKFTYARDGVGRVDSIYEGVNQVATGLLVDTAYDWRGLLDTMRRSTSGRGFLADFTYDPAERLASIANDAVAPDNDLTIGQTVNPAGQIISQTRSNDSYSWNGSVAVDRSYTANGLNQYTSAGTASFTYDPNGNLTSDGSTTFVYDVENRLVSATGAKTALLVYDPLGRLFETSGGTSGVTRFLYDGDELMAEYNGSGAIVRRYVHWDKIDDPVVQYESASIGAAARQFLMPDERGSIAGLFYDDGQSRAKNNYDEYGIPGSGNHGRFQYTGQAWVPELGMYYYKARLYSPTLGRFLQTDPVGYDEDFNLYAYVANDPINNRDPTGAVCTPCIGRAFERAGRRYVVAGVTSQVDSPLPGPADAAAIAIGVGTTGLLLWDVGSAIFREDEAPEESEKPKNPAPQEVQDKIPEDWGEGGPDDDGKGWKWSKPGSKTDGVRWSPGNKNAPEGQNNRGPNIKVTSGGRRLTQGGEPSTSPKPSRENDTHIPDKEWIRWEDWNRRTGGY